MISFLFLVAPGAIVAYVLFARPLLKQRFAKFYAEADGFWAKVWALLGKSATNAWSAGVYLVGQLLQYLDPIAAFFGDPNFSAQVTEKLQANPKVLGYFLMFVSSVTVAARLRSIIKDATSDE